MNVEQHLNEAAKLIDYSASFIPTELKDALYHIIEAIKTKTTQDPNLTPNQNLVLHMFDLLQQYNITNKTRFTYREVQSLLNSFEHFGVSQNVVDELEELVEKGYLTTTISHSIIFYERTKNG